MHIDNKTYKISENNYYKVQNNKTQIVIGTSLRKDNYHIIRLQHKDYGKTKKWNTYTISREGKIYKHYDDKYHTNFLGIKKGDIQSISIILENMGCLFESETGKYINWLNEYCDKDQIIEKEWLEYNYWEKFQDKQIESLILLCRELCEKYCIPKIFIDFQTYHKQTQKFKGIVFRGNYIKDSSDINPLFNISILNKMLNNEFI